MSSMKPIGDPRILPVCRRLDEADRPPVRWRGRPRKRRPQNRRDPPLTAARK